MGLPITWNMSSSSKWARSAIVLSAAWVVLWLGCRARAQGIPVRVAAGAKHSVLLKANGSVWTWGRWRGGVQGKSLRRQMRKRARGYLLQVVENMERETGIEPATNSLEG